MSFTILCYYQLMTLKQKLFIKNFVNNGGNGTQAALAAYDTADPSVAKVIGSENLTKPNIREAIEEALRSKGLSLDVITDNIGHLATARPDKVTGDTVLRANVELLKLHGAYPDKKSYQFSYSVKQQLSSLSFEEVKKELERIDDELKALLK